MCIYTFITRIIQKETIFMSHILIKRLYIQVCTRALIAYGIFLNLMVGFTKSFKFNDHVVAWGQFFICFIKQTYTPIYICTQMRSNVLDFQTGLVQTEVLTVIGLINNASFEGTDWLLELVILYLLFCTRVLERGLYV